MTQSVSSTATPVGAPRSFPFGVSPEAAAPDRDGRGPDTMNRLLLHGARYHDRDTLFLRWERGRRGWAWQPMPDWRADRHTIGIALVLRQRLEVTEGEPVAIWLPLSVEFPLIERAVWSIGAVSVPVWPSWSVARVAEVLADAKPGVLFAPDWETVRTLGAIGGLPESVHAVVPLRGEPEDPDAALPFAQFMEYGGVLDTAERAAMWRTLARSLRPELAASREYAPDGALRWGKLDHATLVAAVERILRRFPPRRGAVYLLLDERPHRFQRALVYAVWADGVTRLAFAAEPGARDRLGELPAPADLLAGPADAVASGLEALPARATPGASAPRRRGLVARVLGSAPPAPAPERPRIVTALVSDGGEPGLGVRGFVLQNVSQAEFEIPVTGPGAGRGAP